MSKILSLLTALVLMLCTGQLLAQISASPETQQITCSTGIAQIHVTNNQQRYLVTVNGGLVIYDNGQEKNLLVTDQSDITVKAVSGSGKVFVSLAADPSKRDSVVVTYTPISLGQISGSTCLAADGTAVYSVPAQTGVSYLWRFTEGGQHSQILSGGNTNQVTVKSIGTGNSQLRVYAYNDCSGELCSVPQTYVWIRKTFSVTQQDFFGVECLDASTLGTDSVVVFSVKPFLGLHSLGDYQWQYSAGLKPLYPSADGSAYSFKVINPLVDQNISVVVGRVCNPGNVVSKILKAAPPLPVLTQTDYCFPTNVTSATFTIDPSYHKTGYVYDWLVPVNWAITSQTATSITVNMDANAGNITVTASNVLCGHTPKTFTVNRSINGAAVSGPSCLDAGAITAVNYTISPLNNNSYTWTLPQGWAFQDPNNKNGSSVWVIPDGIHGGSITASTQGCGGTNTIPAYPVTIGPVTPGAITGSTCVVYGNTATYSIAAVTNATNYEWIVPPGWATPTYSADKRTITVTNVQTSGTLRVRALGCGTTASQYRDLVVTAGPGAPGTISGPACVAQQDNTSIVYSIAAVPNATSYEWQTPSSWIKTFSDNGRTITVTSGITANTTISVRAIGCNNLTSALSSLNITVGPGQPGTLNGPQCVIPGTSGVQYSIAAVSGATRYEWIVPGGWSYTASSNGDAITVTSSITSGGTVSVRGVGCNNEAGPYRSVAVNVGPATPGAISYYVDGIQGSTCIGKGAPHTLTVSVPTVSGATGYVWTWPAGWSGVSPTTSNVTTITTDGSTGGVVTAAATTSGCAGAASSITLLRSGLSFRVTETRFTGTPFSQFAVSALPTGPTYSYKWINANTNVAIYDGTAYQNAFIDVLLNPVIKLEVVDLSSPSCPTTLTITSGVSPTCTDGTCTTTRVAATNAISRTAAAGIAESELIKLYPNPASQELRIALGAELRDAVGYIYSTTGILVSTIKMKDEVAVDVSTYTDGTYFLVIKNGEQVTYQKFIVSH